MLRHTPWFTLAALVIFFFLPLGQSLIQTQFFSGEQLARSINELVLLIVFGIAATLALVECLVRYYFYKSRNKTAPHG